MHHFLVNNCSNFLLVVALFSKGDKMAKVRQKPNVLLANALESAKSKSSDGIIQSRQLTRLERERLIGAGCLTEVIKGWYLLTSPDANSGGTTAWFGGFWSFIKKYLDERFGVNQYCLSAESSLSFHAGDTTVPRQIVILTKKESNKVINLIHDTSILARTELNNFPDEIEFFNSIPIMSISTALSRLSASYYKTHPKNLEIILKLQKLNASDVSRALLKHQSPASASRIIGAYEYFGDSLKAREIKETLGAVDFKLNIQNPFQEYEAKLNSSRLTSPHSARIRIMWKEMREDILAIIETSAIQAPDILLLADKRIKIIQDTYRQDAYHSLSIEGYQVTEELIEKIKNGDWDAHSNEDDRKQKDAMAAKGYLSAFDSVLESVKKTLTGMDMGFVLIEDLQKWYRELFTPAVRANLFQPERLAGYRNMPVYITNSRHVPPHHEAVVDCMQTFFELIREEEHPLVKAILGHFIFVFIHPYMDGNGRIGRFILNLALISGGYNWTIIRIEKRTEYMHHLEEASTNGNIKPFALFIINEMKYWREFNQQ